MNFRITHMIADRTTCSYSPECGGKQTVSEMAATSLEDVVLKLTGKGLYDQGHSLQGGATTVSDPNGGRWDCFKIRELPANETPSALATTRRAEAICEETGLAWETSCALAELERDGGELPPRLARVVYEHNQAQDTLGACYIPPAHVRWPL